MRRLNIAAFVLVLAVLLAILSSLDGITVFAVQPPDAGRGYEAWQRHRDSVKGHAHLERYYTFEDVSAADPTVSGVAGEKEFEQVGGKIDGVSFVPLPGDGASD